MASPTRGGIRPRRALLVGAALALASLGVTASALLGVDVYLHHRYAESVGVNVRGYRGLVAGAKRPGERRVVVLGGSTVFGYGVRTTEAFPALLERRLESRLGQEAVSVINLGYPKEGAWSFRATLEDYARLRYDVAILYEGYNDLRKAHRRVFRHDSPIFRLTGYFPLLPLVLAEKARAIRYGGDLAERYNVEDPVFRPDVADRTSAAALAAAAGVVRSLEAVLGPLSPDGAKPALAAQPGCRDRWRAYCAAMEARCGRASPTARACSSSPSPTWPTSTWSSRVTWSSISTRPSPTSGGSSSSTSGAPSISGTAPSPSTACTSRRRGMP
jgi:hypothetical protein